MSAKAPIFVALSPRSIQPRPTQSVPCWLFNTSPSVKNSTVGTVWTAQDAPRWTACTKMQPETNTQNLGELTSGDIAQNGSHVDDAMQTPERRTNATALSGTLKCARAQAGECGKKIVANEPRNDAMFKHVMCFSSPFLYTFRPQLARTTNNFK